LNTIEKITSELAMYTKMHKKAFTYNFIKDVEKITLVDKKYSDIGKLDISYDDIKDIL